MASSFRALHAFLDMAESELRDDLEFTPEMDMLVSIRRAVGLAQCLPKGSARDQVFAEAKAQIETLIGSLRQHEQPDPTGEPS